MHSSISGNRYGSRPVVLYTSRLTSMRGWWPVIRKVMDTLGYFPLLRQVQNWYDRSCSSVPEWWYLIVFASMFALGIISIEVWPTQMPVWAFILALVICELPEYVQKRQLISLLLYSLRLCDPYRHDSSNYQPASRIKVSGPLLSTFVSINNILA